MSTDSGQLPDPPEAPVYMSAEAAYGWSCGWSAGFEAGVNVVVDSLIAMPSDKVDCQEPNDSQCLAIVGEYLGHPVRCYLPEWSGRHDLTKPATHKFQPADNASRHD